MDILGTYGTPLYISITTRRVRKLIMLKADFLGTAVSGALYPPLMMITIVDGFVALRMMIDSRYRSTVLRGKLVTQHRPIPHG
jgi:hypothetical protein